MEQVFVDTSALYALHDRDDARHHEAATIWERLLEAVSSHELRCVSHGGVVIEASALVQRRLGIEALRDLHHGTLLVIEVVWVDAELHARALSALLAAARRDVSLVDWTSFEVMREIGASRAFAFDADFAAQGFLLEG